MLFPTYQTPIAVTKGWDFYEREVVMDFDIVSLIGQYAFPTVACVAMGYYVKYTEDKHREERDRMADNHTKEINSITEVINNNTIVLKELCVRLESILKRDDDD